MIATSLIADVAARADKPAEDPPAVPVPQSDCETETGHDEPHHMHGARLRPEQIGCPTYKFVGTRVSLWTTMVLPAYRKRGVATELATKALNRSATDRETDAA